MKLKKVMRAAAVLFVSSAAICAAGGWLLLSSHSPVNKASAINATRTWARLDAFPESAVNIRNETAGSAFSREFRISFTASEEEITRWLNQSPGTREAHPETQSDGTTIYKIAPGKGAQFAEVTLSKDRKTVFIRTYWS